MDPLAVLLRWAHVLAAVTALGGLIFARFAVVPAAEELGDEAASRLHAGIRRRWLPWVIGAIVLLLASGLANFLLLQARVESAPELWGENWMRQHRYHALFGVKFLLAMIVFYLASGLVGRGAGTQWIRDARRQWLSVAVGLGVAVVLISGWMRQLHTGVNDLPDPVRDCAKTHLRELQAANAGSGRDPDDESGARGPGRAADSGSEATPPEKADGQEAKEADGGSPAEDRETAATAGRGEETAR